jgi:hypothetical protein
MAGKLAEWWRYRRMRREMRRANRSGRGVDAYEMQRRLWRHGDDPDMDAVTRSASQGPQMPGIGGP